MRWKIEITESQKWKAIQQEEQVGICIIVDDMAKSKAIDIGDVLELVSMNQKHNWAFDMEASNTTRNCKYEL